MNTNSNHSKGIQSIQMQILTIQKGLKAFDSKFKPFERNSKLSNPISKISKGIRGIRMQIQTIRKELEAFECKIEPFERDSMVSK